MTLQLYIFRQLAIGLAFAVGGLVFVAIPGIAVNAVHKLAGVSMGALLGYLPMVLIDLVPYLFPIGFLLAVVATYGRLASDNEWTAILMAGVHPLRMLIPAAVIALGFAGLTFYLATEVSPGLNQAKREYAKNSVVKSFKNLNRGQTELSFKEFYLAAQFRNPDSNTFREVTIHIPAREQGGDQERARTVLADMATIEVQDDAMEIQLFNALHVGKGRVVDLENFKASVDLDLLFKTGKGKKVKWKYLSSRKLMQRIVNGEIADVNMGKALFEWHWRHTLSATYFMFLLLGVPTALILRRGTQLGALAVAVSYALVYYLLAMRLGKTLGASETVPPFLAAWATPLIGTVVGMLLCWRAFRR